MRPFSYRSIRNVLYHVNLNHLSHMIKVIINEIINPKYNFFFSLQIIILFIRFVTHRDSTANRHHQNAAQLSNQNQAIRD